MTNCEKKRWDNSTLDKTLIVTKPKLWQIFKKNKGRNGTDHGQFRKSWEFMRRSWESHEKVMRNLWQSHEKVKRKSWESLKKVMRKSRDSYKKVMRKSSKSHQKVYFPTLVWVLCKHVCFCVFLFSPFISTFIITAIFVKPPTFVSNY